MKKKKTLKRELIEWGAILSIFAVLFFTGLHTVVIGNVQRIVLATGIMQPSLKTESEEPASYKMLLRDASGNITDFDSFKGKVIFMNFWATWCPPCIAEMPDIQSLYDEVNNDNIAFVMISVDEQPEKAFTFADKKSYTFPVYSLHSELPSVYHSRSIPTTFVISKNGQIVSRREGMAKYNTKKFKKFLAYLNEP